MKKSDTAVVGEKNVHYYEPPRKWCTSATKEKAVFPNYTAALNFLQEQNGMIRDGATYACSIYKCNACGGWHLTHYIPDTQWANTQAEGIFVNGVLYRAYEAEAKANTCMLCDDFIVRRCRITSNMPCLAYKKDNIYFKRQDGLTVVRNVVPE